MGETAGAIYISNHARKQAASRHPDFYRRRGVHGIYAEVSQAMADGRRAKRVPRWASYRARRAKMAEGRTGLFVWNEEETRCYAVRAARQGEFASGARWIVVTVLSAPGATDP